MGGGLGLLFDPKLDLPPVSGLRFNAKFQLSDPPGD